MDVIGLRDLLSELERRPGPAGLTAHPITFVDLDELESLSPDEAAVLDHRLPDDLRVYVGIRTRPLPTPLIGPGQQILERLTTTVSPWVGALPGGTPEGRQSAISASVRVEDPMRTAEAIAAQAERTPDAVLIMDTALRIAERAAARETLILESNWYTSLLAGPEYEARLAMGGQITGPPAEVEVTREDDQRIVTISWLTPRSGMDHAVRVAVAKALREARDDHQATIELRAEGPDFCAEAIPDDNTQRDRNVYLRRLREHPGVAAWLVHRRLCAHVQGSVTSAGLELAAFARYISAAQDARFSVPHLAFGLCFGAGGTVSLTRRIGRWRTAYLALTGAQIDAATALRWGLVDAVGEEEGPMGPAHLDGATMDPEIMATTSASWLR